MSVVSEKPVQSNLHVECKTRRIIRSDYVRNKQVLYPVTKELLEKLNCKDIYDLEDRCPFHSNFKLKVLSITKALEIIIGTLLGNFSMTMVQMKAILEDQDF